MDKILLTLKEGLPRLGLELTEEQLSLLCQFANDVVAQNQVMNLTAITEPEAVAKLHLLDSLSLLTLADLDGKRMIDVGCGAGFPGVPVKIACTGVKLTLLDSLGKRMAWLEQTLPALGIDAKCVTARAEEFVTGVREQYDIATSRAVARLNILLELTAPYVKIGGRILAMKGNTYRQELAEAKNAISRLGLELEKTVEFPLDGTAHAVIVLKKVAHTPAQYPRRYAKIKQLPL